MGVGETSMTSQASLTGFRTKLVNCIDDLRTKREQLNDKIRQDEQEKIEIENKLPKLSMELSRSSDKIERLTASKTEIAAALAEITTCNQKIEQAKANYKKVVQKELEYKARKAAKGM